MKTSKYSYQAKIFKWEMWGILFIMLLGSLLHFTFDLSGSWKPLGIISAVNESVWEHLKLVFWPAVFWMVIEYYFVYRNNKDNYPNFLLAKAIGAYLMPVVIVIIFYSYTIFTGESILAVDLSSFVIAVIIGQFVSYRLLRDLKSSRVYNWLGLAMLVVAIILFAMFTFFPPEVGLFRDPPTGGYGIIQ